MLRPMKVTLTDKQKHELENQHDKTIETRGSRSHLNIAGALNLFGIAALLSIITRASTAKISLGFCVGWEKATQWRIISPLFLDGAGYHRNDWVKDAAYVLNIELHYLPPYTPNLNPIERLWKVMNEQVRNNVCFKSKRDFIPI